MVICYIQDVDGHVMLRSFPYFPEKNDVVKCSRVYEQGYDIVKHTYKPFVGEFIYVHFKTKIPGNQIITGKEYCKIVDVNEKYITIDLPEKVRGWFNGYPDRMVFSKTDLLENTRRKVKCVATIPTVRDVCDKFKFDDRSRKEQELCDLLDRYEFTDNALIEMPEEDLDALITLLKKYTSGNKLPYKEILEKLTEGL